MHTSKRRYLAAWIALGAFLAGVATQANALDTKSLQLRAPVTSADTLATARRQGSFSVNGISWQCTGARCTASASPVAGLSPVTLCQGLAREVGAMRAFTAANHALNDAELKQCNSAVANAAMPSLKPQTGLATVPSLPGPSKAPSATNTPDSAPAFKGANVAAPSGFVVQQPSRMITTAALNFNGLRFSRKTIETQALALNGLRVVPKFIDISALTFTGQRFQPKSLTTGPIALTGLRERRSPLTKGGDFEPRVVNTDSITLNGQRFRPVEFGTSSMSFTGNR